jgi:biotin transport system substrate-specific component
MPVRVKTARRRWGPMSIRDNPVAIWPLRIVFVAIGVALLAASAHIALPFWPVPMTMQSGVVLLLGAAYGSGLAEATVGAYLVAGAVGLPVLATGAGLAYMAGPTVGYLVGFLAAASFMGQCSSQGVMRGWFGTLVAFAVGAVIIFACGIGWLSLLIGPQKALAAGLLPFLPSEATKLVMAVLLYRAGAMVRPAFA